MRLLRIVRGLAALLVLSALLAGVPAALVVYIGWPLPAHLPTRDELFAVLTMPLTDEAITDALACLVWAAWAGLTAATGVEVIGEFSGRALPRLPGITWARTVTGALIGAIATAAPAAAATAVTAPTYAAHGQADHPPVHGPLAGSLRQPAAHSTAPGVRPDAELTADAAHSRNTHTHRRSSVTIRSGTSLWPGRAADTDRGDGSCGTGARQHTVAPGENLWTIAARHAGPDASAQQIAKLVRAIDAANGVITDPRLIRPGWLLTIPAPAPGDGHHRRPPRQDQHQPPDGRSDHTPRPARTPPPHSTATPQPTRSTDPHSTDSRRNQSHDQSQGSRHDAHGGFIQLPSGALAGAALAASVAGALALVRARRRHTYTPRHPAPGRRPTDHGLSPVIKRLVTLHHRTRRAAATAVDGEGSATHPAPDVEQAPVSMWAGAVAPAHIETGARGARPVTIDLLDYGGLVVTGSEAAAALRGLVTALYARSADVEVTVVDVDQGLGMGLSAVPGVAPYRRLLDAVTQIETASIGRARMLADQGIEDFRAHRRRHPEDPCPLLALVAWQASTSAASRIAALARAGQRRGIVVLVGTEQMEAAHAYAQAGLALVQVDADGQVHSATPERLSVAMDGARLQCPDVTEATEILRVLAANRIPEAGASAHADAEADIENDSESAAKTLTAPTPVSHTAAPPAPGGAPRPDNPARSPGSPNQEAGPGPAVDPPPAPDDGRPGVPGPPNAHAYQAAPPRDERGSAPMVSSDAPPVRVRVLGPIQITAGGEEIRSGLRTTSRELLAWFALHPDGVSLEQTLEAIWPGTPYVKARRRYWSAMSTLRTRLRKALDRTDLHFIGLDGDFYRIRGREVAVDLWDFEAGLARAAHAEDPSAEVGALRDAATAYRGEFAAGADLLWAEPAREDLRRRALDTHVRLAELEAALGRNHRAVTTLDAARRVDPYAEEIYQRLMRLHHRLGNFTAARVVFDDLRDKLADLDIAPNPTTIGIINKISAQQRRTTRVREAAPDAATDPTGMRAAAAPASTGKPADRQHPRP